MDRWMTGDRRLGYDIKAMAQCVESKTIDPNENRAKLQIIDDMWGKYRYPKKPKSPPSDSATLKKVGS